MSQVQSVSGACRATRRRRDAPAFYIALILS